jgi:tetratricopeptide (TPR) repeat protein
MMKFLTGWYYKQIAVWAATLGRREVSAEFWLRYAPFVPNDAKPYAAAAHCKSELNRTAEAEALLRKAVEVDPKYAHGWFNLGFMIQKRSDHEEALKCFDQAVRHNEKLDRAHYGRALSLIALDRPEEAKAALQRNIDLQPMSPYGYYQLAALQHRLGDEKSYRKLIKQLASFEPKLAVQLQKETGVDAGIVDPYAKYYR